MITEFCLSSNTVCVDRSINFLDQSLQYSTRSAFGKVIGTIGNHILHCLGPAYGSGELSYQVCLDFSGICVRQSVHVLIYRAFRSMNSVALIAASSSTLAGFINGEWKALPLQRQGTFSTGSFHCSQALLIPSIEPEMTICPGQL